MRYLILFIIPFLLLGCSKSDKEHTRYTFFDDLIDNGKNLPMGDERDVYVFCDLDNWSKLKPYIQSSIEQEIVLVYPEKYFNLLLTDIKDVEKYKSYRNLLFIGDLESSGKVSKYIIDHVAQDFVNRVKQSGGDLFVAKNFASRDQITLFLLWDTKQNLEKIGALQSENIFKLLLNRYKQRLGFQCYQQAVIPAKFFQPYKYTLQIPDNYTLFSNDRAGNFISFLYRAKMQEREIPDKYVSIYHEAMPENKISPEWHIQKRIEMGKKYFEGDEFDPQYVRKEIVKLGKYDTLRLTGAWKNQKHMIGGAFQSYSFWKDGTAYIVDNIVYFPAGDKLPSLLELSVISSTIQIK